MRLVMTIGAKRNAVVDMVVPRNNMMHSHSMESATYAAPATAVYQELLGFSLVETHEPSPSSSLSSNDKDCIRNGAKRNSGYNRLN